MRKSIFDKTKKGGKGSGFFGHKGRDVENKRGGSVPRPGGMKPLLKDDEDDGKPGFIRRQLAQETRMASLRLALAKFMKENPEKWDDDRFGYKQHFSDKGYSNVEINRLTKESNFDEDGVDGMVEYLQRMEEEDRSLLGRTNKSMKGGKGSGFFGHAGRDAENKRGGSVPRSGGMEPLLEDENDSEAMDERTASLKEDALNASELADEMSDRSDKYAQLYDRHSGNTALAGEIEKIAEMYERIAEYYANASDYYKEGKELSGDYSIEKAERLADEVEGLEQRLPDRLQIPIKSVSKDMLVYLSEHNVKSIQATDGMIGAYSIVFGNNTAKDFHGNWFTKDTFLGHNRGNGSVATFNHRMPFFKSGQFDPQVEKVLKSLSKKTMKNPIHTTVDAVGVFSTLVMDLSDEYEKMVYDLASKGKLKWSSGTAPQLFEAEPSGELKMFVIAETALTPIPAEYRMLEHKVMPMKAYFDFVKGGKGSGFFGHAGRDAENKRGGSVPRGGDKDDKSGKGPKVIGGLPTNKSPMDPMIRRMVRRNIARHDADEVKTMNLKQANQSLDNQIEFLGQEEKLQNRFVLLIHRGDERVRHRYYASDARAVLWNARSEGKKGMTYRIEYAPPGTY